MTASLLQPPAHRNHLTNTGWGGSHRERGQGNILLLYGQACCSPIKNQGIHSLSARSPCYSKVRRHQPLTELELGLETQDVGNVHRHGLRIPLEFWKLGEISGLEGCNTGLKKRSWRQNGTWSSAVELPVGMPASRLSGPGSCPGSALHFIFLVNNAPGGCRTWVPTSHVGDLDRVPSAWPSCICRVS